MKKLIIIALTTIGMSLSASYQPPRPSLLDRDSFIEYNTRKNGEFSRAMQKKVKNGYTKNLKQQYESAKDQTQDTYEATKEQVQEAYETAKEKTREALKAARKKAKEAYESAKDYFQKGKEKISQQYEELIEDND